MWRMILSLCLSEGFLPSDADQMISIFHFTAQRDEENERDIYDILVQALNVMPINSFYINKIMLSWQERSSRLREYLAILQKIVPVAFLHIRVYLVTTFELVHVASNDIRFPLIYRFERVYLVGISRTIVGQFYPWIYLFFHQRETSYFKDCLGLRNRVNKAGIMSQILASRFPR